jgi:hypothetical protein
VERVGEHAVPAGPLAIRWMAYEIDGPVRAGAATAATVVVENAGSASWRSVGTEGVQLAYHWLDELGNPIVWDGVRTAFAEPVDAGAQAELRVTLHGPIPPGRYRLAFDLVDEGRFWFAELGNTALELPTDVEPRIGRRALAVELHGGESEETRVALASQEEPLVPRAEAEAVAHLGNGCIPAPDWSRRLLDAHAEGYAAVGGSIEPVGGLLGRRRLAAALAPWAPGTGRIPAFEHPLLCPSVLTGLAPPGELEGLPALDPPADEPWLYDGRIRLRLRV